MAHISSIPVGINLNPIPKDKTEVKLAFSHLSLCNLGFNIPVEISTASAFVAQDSTARRSICVTGHFDTGATRTSIDSRLASKLGLSPIGFTTSNTAAGPQGTPDYAIDMSFMSNLP